MTDIKKIIEEQINQAWARGTNWAMQGLGYALDTDADTQAIAIAVAVAEDRARAVGEGVHLGVHLGVNNFETWMKQYHEDKDFVGSFGDWIDKLLTSTLNPSRGRSK